MERSRKTVVTLSIVAVAAIIAVFVCLFLKKTPKDPAELISKLDGVVSVKPIEQNETDEEGNPQFCYKYKYIVTFRQPLDWKDPSAGTFDQRVIVGIDDMSAPNVAQTQGYLIPDKKIYNDPRTDLELILNGNYIEIEHRFFGESKPEGLSNDDTALWNYLTTYNQASDQNKIITELKKVLPGKWVATGKSKGGLTANLLTMYYPDAIDLTVSYVAPLCDEVDERFYNFVYNEAQSVHYGEKERNMMTEFQIEALKKREELMPLFEEFVEEENATLRPQNSIDILFDVCVLESAVGFWQYNQEFYRVEECMSMPENSESEKADKLKAMMEIIKESGIETNSKTPYFPYFVQTAKEIGNYFYDFSFLRKALRERGMNPEDYLVVKEDQVYSGTNLLLTDAQSEAFKYDGTTNKNLKEWVNSTDSKVIMIYGASDPWYSVRIPDTDNPNVKIFVSQRKPHTALIMDHTEKYKDYSFEEEEQSQILQLIKETLEIE